MLKECLSIQRPAFRIDIDKVRLVTTLLSGGSSGDECVRRHQRVASFESRSAGGRQYRTDERRRPGVCRDYTARRQSEMLTQAVFELVYQRSPVRIDAGGVETAQIGQNVVGTWQLRAHHRNYFRRFLHWLSSYRDHAETSVALKSPAIFLTQPRSTRNYVTFSLHPSHRWRTKKIGFPFGH